MAGFDDDDLDDFRIGGDSAGRGRKNGDEPSDDWDDPDERDLVPDEMATVRCTRCRKLILEDSVRCPYCKELQLDSHQNRQPLWVILAAIACIVLILAYWVFNWDGAMAWFR